VRPGARVLAVESGGDRLPDLDDPPNGLNQSLLPKSWKRTILEKKIGDGVDEDCGDRGDVRDAEQKV